MKVIAVALGLFLLSLNATSAIASPSHCASHASQRSDNTNQNTLHLWK